MQTYVLVGGRGRLLGELRSAVDALAAVDPDELEPQALGETIVEMTRQRDRLDAVCARFIAAHDRLKVWQREGARSEKEWLARRCRITPGEAGARAAAARSLDLLPATAEAAVAGEIGAGQARVAANAVRDLPREVLDGLDKLVAEQGPGGDAGQLRCAVDDYAHRTAPESLAERERRAYARRRLSITKIGDGGAVLDGYLDVLGAETVLTALAPLAAPSGADDARTPEQRRADALVDLARRSIDGGVRAGAQRPSEGRDQGTLRATGGQRPHVTVVIDLESLLKRGEEGAAAPDGGRGPRPGAPPAVLDRLGALSGEAARLLACDAQVSRVITAGPSQILDVGRSRRTITAAQRRALAVRDKGCVGCRAPAGWCDVHHVMFWSQGGRTDLHNLVLLCPRCHRSVHDGTHRPVKETNGAWSLRRHE